MQVIFYALLVAAAVPLGAIAGPSLVNEGISKGASKWQRPAETGPVQRAPLDRITPPPTNPVSLDPEWGEREGVLVRYSFPWGTFIFSSLVDEIQDVAIVYILVPSQGQQNSCIDYLTTNGVPLNNVEFIICETNSVWIRDYGPWFVWEEDSNLSIIDMPYAWSPSWVYDDYVPEFLETYWGLNYYGPDFWHDGGNMMTDGHGTMMMSTYVNESNPGMSNTEINQIYQDYFGQDTIYIFEEIDFDLTGHIDLWAKMLNDTTIMVAQMQPDDPNHDLVESHAAAMGEIPTACGGTFNIVRCPMPPRSYYWGWYYKSYINSLLINKKAIVPICGLEWDDEALDAYQDALGPDWEVVGINCNGIAFAGGAVHCTTIGVPLDREKYLFNADLTFEPVSPPIVIPAQGGAFEYRVEIENLEAEVITFDFWIDATLPDGSAFGPVLLREDISLTQLAIISRDMIQNVPGGAPAGLYSYNGYVGSYVPKVVSAETSFDFEKLQGGEEDSHTGAWPTAGWDEAVSFEVDGQIPEEFLLLSAFPNPFNSTTQLSYNLAEPSHVSLEIYNISGQQVVSLVGGARAAGSHRVSWNPEKNPNPFTSGIYFCRIETTAIMAGNRSVDLLKLILLK